MRMYRTALLTLLAPVGNAMAQRPMTADDVLAVKQVGDAQISPDGKWVAYVVSAVDLAQNAVTSDVWLVAADCAGPAACPPVRLTTNPKADGQPRWSPDGRWIAFVSAREDRPQIWMIRPHGGEAEKLTDSKTGVPSFQWSPDGTRIALVASPTPKADDGSRSDIHIVTVATGERRKLIENAGPDHSPRWSGGPRR